MSTCVFVFFQAEDGIRDLVRSRGLGDVYKRQQALRVPAAALSRALVEASGRTTKELISDRVMLEACLLYTSDAADERSSVDLGGRRIIKKKKDAEKVTVTRVMRKWRCTDTN